jgi:DNA-binding CsgD family transcriptional regulator
MTANRIPAGLIDSKTEFFTVLTGTEQRAMCLYDGKPYCYQATPECRKEIIRRDMKANPVKDKAMEVMVGLDEDLKLEKYIMCNYGALNDDADIDDDGKLSAPEYVPCPLRGTCKQEGVGCSNILVGDVLLSKRETPVFRLVKLEDEEIANILFISVHTVRNHFANIRMKTGFKDKNAMIYWATRKGII